MSRGAMRVSEGEPDSWGWGGTKDVKAAVAYLERRPDVEPGRIGGLGLSVGGEMMLEAAADRRPGGRCRGRQRGRRGS
jgi:dienelactone hydrolase